MRLFLERVGAAGAERFAALGEGEDIRLSGEGLAGGALASGGRVVHLAAHGVGR
ncbi:MAG: ARPP-1 family domain-containing protein [Gemmatimonadaceae bacterium]